MEQAPSRGHEASPQSGLGVGCKRCSSSHLSRGDPGPLAAYAEPGSDKCGRIDKAHDCCHYLRSLFELGDSGIAWRREQAAKGGAVSSMYFH